MFQRWLDTPPLTLIPEETNIRRSHKDWMKGRRDKRISPPDYLETAEIARNNQLLSRCAVYWTREKIALSKIAADVL